jgi:hypothetical protein
MKIVCALALIVSTAIAQPDSAEVSALIPWLLENERALREIPFSEVITATSGHKIIPLDGKNPDDKEVIDELARCFDEALLQLNKPEGLMPKIERINEVSSHVEDQLRSVIDASPMFSCDFPRTAAGQVQRSGYPDLRVVEEKTGRVFYLDPKLYAAGSDESTFRTFYFEPERTTNKVLDDAAHLIIGIEHARAGAGRWRFVAWRLVDLSHFRVRLKAEFQGSNRDLYKDDATVARSRP